MEINIKNFKKLVSLASTIVILGTPIVSKGASHVVSDHDTFIRISERYYGTGDYWKELMQYNGISNPKLLVTGSIINVPELSTLIGPIEKVEPVKKTNTISISTSNDYTKDGITYHLIGEKDTLIKICKYFYGNEDYWKALMSYNGITNSRLLISGSYLKVPSASTLVSLGLVEKELPVIEEKQKTSLDLTHDYSKDGITYHLVGKKDTLTRISRYFYNSDDYAEALMAYNGIKNARLLITDSFIKIPTLDTLKSLGLVDSKTIMPETSNTENKKAKAKDKVIDGIIYHSFTNKDTLWNLCSHYYGTGIYWQEVAEYNGITNQRKIPVGFVVMFPEIEYVREKHLIKTK